MPDLESTAIRRVSYDEAERVLFVTYVGGVGYAYFDVAEDEYEALLRAPSKGAFVNARIKEHRYERL